MTALTYWTAPHPEILPLVREDIRAYAAHAIPVDAGAMLESVERWDVERDGGPIRAFDIFSIGHPGRSEREALEHVVSAMVCLRQATWEREHLGMPTAVLDSVYRSLLGMLAILTRCP